MIQFAELSTQSVCMVTVNSGSLCISCSGQANDYVVVTYMYLSEIPTEPTLSVIPVTQAGRCFTEPDPLKHHFVVFARSGGVMDRYPVLIHPPGSTGEL